MRRLWVTLASAWVWLVLVLCIALAVPIMALLRLVTAPFDPRRYVVGRTFRWVGIITGKASPLWRFHVYGTEHRDRARAYVVVSNHESFVDIFLLSHLPWEMKWMFKQELFKIPVLGWLLRLSGDIPIRRGVGKSAIEAMGRAREVIASGMSVMIFAEGTRSATGEMLPFKDGAFRLAIDAGAPILPLAVVGTRNALNKHDWRIGPADARVRVLPPVETTGLTVAESDELKQRVRTMIQDARTAMLDNAVASARPSDAA